MKRDQVSVDGAEKDEVAEYCDAPIDLSAAHAHVVGQRSAITPQRPAGARIERRDVARRLGDVHDAVDDDRGRFELLERVRLETTRRA